MRTRSRMPAMPTPTRCCCLPGRRLGVSLRRGGEIFAVRTSAQRIHAVELTVHLRPAIHARRGFYTGPPLFAAFGNDFGVAVARAAGVVFFGDEAAIVFLVELAIDPNVSETFTAIHVTEDDVAWI